MDLDLPEDVRELQRIVRDFAVQEVAPVAEELDRTKAFPYELVAKMGELGWGWGVRDWASPRVPPRKQPVRRTARVHDPSPGFPR